MKLIYRLRSKYVIVVIVVILISTSTFLWGKKAIIEFKMIAGKSVDVGDFQYTHNGSCGNEFWDEGKTRSVYGYVEWINVGDMGFVLLEDKNRSLSKFRIVIEGNKNEEIFEKLLDIKNEREEFSDKKINVSGVVAGGDYQVGGIKGFGGGCFREAHLIINNPSQINY